MQTAAISRAARLSCARSLMWLRHRKRARGPTGCTTCEVHRDSTSKLLRDEPRTLNLLNAEPRTNRLRVTADGLLHQPQFLQKGRRERQIVIQELVELLAGHV